MDKLIQSIEEEFDLAKKRAVTKIKGFFGDGNQTSARANMKLKFMNKVSQIILTGEEIKGEGNTPIELALVDDPSENIVDDGAEASASVEIVLLKGESDASQGDDEEFNQNIVPEIQGKKPLLDGNVPLKLQRGVGVVEKIKFRHHAIKIRPPVFKLGARVVGAFDGVRVKEAKTESFTVKDFRNKYHEKYEAPSLSDKVLRLVNIGKGGTKRLRDNGINTVEDFLIRLLINPDELKSIVNLGTERWEATVKNARACPTDERMYCYINFEQKTGLVFNILGQVQGLYFESHYYSPMSMLSEKHKDYAQELLASAYKNWGDVMSFDDMNSLQQHLTCLSIYMDPPDSLNPDCPGGCCENMEASEMIGESSSRRSNISFHSLSSATNSVRETGREDFSSFGTDDVDHEPIEYNAAMHSPSNLETMLREIDEFFQTNMGCNVQSNGLMNEPDADEQRAATDVTFVESEVVQTRNPPKRWKKLFWVSIWFSIRKKVSEDVTRNPKRQKVGK